MMMLGLTLLSCANELVNPFRSLGQAIAYSGYRVGQSPKTGELPSREQILEDLRILERHWKLIRIYASDQHGEDVLAKLLCQRL